MNALLLNEAPPAEEEEPAFARMGGFALLSGSSSQRGLPLDLTEWMSRDRLVTAIQRLAHAQDAETMTPVFSFETGHFCQPWMMLAIVTYSYAIGVYRSESISRLVRNEQQLGVICEGQFPDADAVRHFRDQNRAAIHHFLEKTIQVVLLSKAAEASGGRSGNPACWGRQATFAQPETRAWLAAEADERLRRAEREDRPSGEYP